MYCLTNNETKIIIFNILTLKTNCNCLQRDDNARFATNVKIKIIKK